MSLNDVLLGRESGENKPEEPYRTASPMPPAKQPCAQCGTPSLLEQTPVGLRCRRCALNNYAADLKLEAAACHAPSVTSSSSDLAIRIVLRVAFAVIFGIIYAVVRMH